MYAMNDVKGLVQDLREVKFSMLKSENILSSRVYSRGVTPSTAHRTPHGFTVTFDMFYGQMLSPPQTPLGCSLGSRTQTFRP